MASRIAVMEKGAVQQIATPVELYEHPRNRFVADFIGKVNLIDATVTGQKGKVITCDAKGLGKVEINSGAAVGSAVALAVRPEKLKISKSEPRGTSLLKLQGKVRDVAYYGDTSHVVVEGNDGLNLSVNVQNESREGGSGVERGQKVWLHWAPEDSIILTE